jgi:hypothetical protein
MREIIGTKVTAESMDLTPVPQRYADILQAFLLIVVPVCTSGNTVAQICSDQKKSGLFFGSVLML